MEALLLVAGVLFLYMSVLFVLSLILKDNSIADIGYGIGVMISVGAALLLSPLPEVPVLVLAALPFVWGVRLATRIYLKNRGKPEDFRYKKWREEWGSFFVMRSYLQVYLLQGVVIYVVALPVLLAIIFPSALSPLLYGVGIAAWLGGFFFEVVGDYQLDRFLADPKNKGKLMMEGLWRYSRHPNYFGESTMWWGIALAAISLTTVPFVPFVSPILITFLLLFVSGVPMLEKKHEEKPEWTEYRARTSVFIPLPPKSASE